MGGKGANVNAHGGIKEQTALHIAAAHGNIECVRELVRLGADVNATCEAEDSGGNALHWAAFFGQEAMIKELLSLGCKADVKNKKEKTPKDVADSRAHGGC